MALLLYLQGVLSGRDIGEGVALAVGRCAGGSGEGFSSYLARALQQRHGNTLACAAVAGDGAAHGCACIGIFDGELHIASQRVDIVAADLKGGGISTGSQVPLRVLQWT